MRHRGVDQRRAGRLHQLRATHEAAWGKEYRRGRYFHKLVGIPAIANAGLKVLDSINHPGFRAHLLFWEGWCDAKRG